MCRADSSTRHLPGSHQTNAACRYEELRAQLRSAQDAAEQEQEEEELARATAAVARLTAPSQRSNGVSARNGAVQLQEVPHICLQPACCCWPHHPLACSLYFFVRCVYFSWWLISYPFHIMSLRALTRENYVQAGEGPAARAVKSLEEQVSWCLLCITWYLA